MDHPVNTASVFFLFFLFFFSFPFQRTEAQGGSFEKKRKPGE